MKDVGWSAYWACRAGQMSFQFFTTCHFKLCSNSFVEYLVSVCPLFNFHSSFILPPPSLVHPLSVCHAKFTTSQHSTRLNPTPPSYRPLPCHGSSKQQQQPSLFTMSKQCCSFPLIHLISGSHISAHPIC